MAFLKTDFAGVYLFEPLVFEDERVFFFKFYN